MNTAARSNAYSALAIPSGGFAMVANDGRGSLRGLIHRAGKPYDDASLGAFKVLVARHLGPLCSAMLIDRQLGAAALLELAEAAPSAGCVLSVDDFDEPEFGPLAGSRLDRAAIADAGAASGAQALKLFLFWNPQDDPEERQRDAADFVSGCASLGVLSLLEGVVQAPADDPKFDDYLVQAATEFGEFRPDLYKTQVPSLGRKPLDAIEETSSRLSQAVGAPWVALSNGVPPERFADTVAAVCRGGASGFLAGRATWSPAVTAEDPAKELSTTGAARFREFAAAVADNAQPWWNAAGLPAPSERPVPSSG
ncbi:MAG: hypothetical protein Q7V58_02690 [Actinomycetota bacterium]|nr:hypothetical protein [Actinomycetota bacterium]